MGGVNCRLKAELQRPLDQQSASPHLPFHTAWTPATRSRPSSTLLELSLRVTRLSPAGLRQAPAWSYCATARYMIERSQIVRANSSWSAVSKPFLAALTQGLSELGWSDGRNLRMEIRWAASNVDRMRMLAKEVVDLQPDVILTDTAPVTAAVQRETRTIPIVFVTAHSTVKCNGQIFGVEENLARGLVAENLSGARVEFILDPLDIGIGQNSEV
jgi:hypothetical protein